MNTFFVENTLTHAAGLVLNGKSIDFEGGKNIDFEDNNPHFFSVSRPRSIV